MPFVQVVKNKAYFKRFQVKFRRRREGKTDYGARRKLVTQDKNKYNTPKYRLVVRFSNRYVYCQIISAEIIGDKVLAQASSKELPRFGLKCGLKNYAAAYCTGLLLARRTLGVVGKDKNGVGLDEKYTGAMDDDEDNEGEEIHTLTGEVEYVKPGKAKHAKKYFVSEYDFNHADGRKPFRAYLDVGIATCTTGCRVFAALKGAVDGGLDIPHNEKRFAGYDREGKSYDADTMTDRLKSGHVKEFMEYLQEEDAEQYNKCFSKYIEAGIGPDELEELIPTVWAKIREDPEQKREGTFEYSGDKKYKKMTKKSLEQRKADAAAKKAKILEDFENAEDEDDDEEMADEEEA